jgi:hypothetical protein
MPDASVSLGLEADQFDRDLARSERNLTGAHNRMGQSATRNMAAHDNLLRSNHRVARQVETFSKTLISGGSAADVLATGLEGIGRSTNLALGPLAALGVGAAIIGRFAERAKALREVREEIEKLTKAAGAARFEGLDALEEKLSKAKPGEWDNAIRGTALALTGGMSSLFMDTPWGANKGYDQSLDVIAGLKKKRADMMGDKADAQNNLTNTRLTDGEVAAEKRQAEMNHDAKVELAKGDQRLITAAGKELDLAYRVIAAKEDHLKAETEIAQKKQAEATAENRRNRVQQTLGELAAIPSQSVVGDGTDYGRWDTGNKARAAQQWDAYGESRRMAGDMSGAQDAFNYSTDIKRSIPGLKDSEKDLKNELTGALEEAKVLQEIKTNTGGMFKGR